MSAALENVIRRNAHVTERIVKNAMGYVVSNNQLGLPVVTTFDNTISNGMIKLFGEYLVTCCKSGVRDIDPTNDLQFIRLATRKFEYLIAPEKEFNIFVVQ